MSLFFDENLSGRLVELLADLYPGSEHALGVGLGGAGDGAIWDYAKRRGLVIVSKDADFFDRSVMSADAPKIIWIRLGNCSIRDVARVLRAENAAVLGFLADEERTCLRLGERLVRIEPRRTRGG